MNTFRGFLCHAEALKKHKTKTPKNRNADKDAHGLGGVNQSVLVEYYCCFHLNSGAATVGPDIVVRNKKRLLLCTPHPQWSEFKIHGILAANKPQKVGASSVCSCVHRVQNLIRVPYSCRAVFLFIHRYRQCVNEGKTSTYVGVCASLLVVLKSNSFAFSCKSHSRVKKKYVAISRNFVSPPHRRA